MTDGVTIRLGDSNYSPRTGEPIAMALSVSLSDASDREQAVEDLRGVLEGLEYDLTVTGYDTPGEVPTSVPTVQVQVFVHQTNTKEQLERVWDYTDGRVEGVF